MRYLGGLLTILLLAGCSAKSEPPRPAPSSAVASPVSARPGPVTAAADPEPTKAASLWLDRQTDPRQKGAYAPRDECRDLPGARAFREKLAAAVEARDAEAIAAMASPDIRLGFGGDDGRQHFLAALQAPDGKALAELAALLPLGCAGSDGGGLTIPWYFAQDYGDVDSYSAMLVMGADVPIHAVADAGSAAKRRLSWDLVTLDQGWYPEKRFQQVTVVGSGGGGAKGYVATDMLRSMLDYRLLATRQGETWMITAFLAGD